MVERPTETVRRYEQGDSHERLCMFLQYPDLRDVFLDIDAKDSMIKNKGKKSNRLVVSRILLNS